MGFRTRTLLGKFIQQENFVDFKDNKQNLLGKRYYYVFKKNELESIIQKE